MTSTATPDPRDLPGLQSIDEVTERLGTVGYISSRPISTAVYLAHHLRKPILVEGPAGVGKTELARSMAESLGMSLLRMQCYEGLDESRALYEWKYGKQLLYTQILKEKINDLISDADGLDASLRKLAGFQDLFFSGCANLTELRTDSRRRILVRQMKCRKALPISAWLGE